MSTGTIGLIVREEKRGQEIKDRNGSSPFQKAASMLKLPNSENNKS